LFKTALAHVALPRCKLTYNFFIIAIITLILPVTRADGIMLRKNLAPPFIDTVTAGNLMVVRQQNNDLS
jgi:hypothetical protein